MIKRLIFDMKKWFSPNGMVINADSLDYYALPERIRIAKGTKISVGRGQINNGEEFGGDAWLQDDVIGEVYGFTKADAYFKENSSFMFTFDENKYYHVLKDEDGEYIHNLALLKVDCDKCQIISGK